MENMMNFAFEFLQQLRSCIIGFEVVVKDTFNSPSDRRKRQILSILQQKIPEDPLKSELIRILEEINDAFNYDEIEEDLKGMRFNARAKKNFELARINNQFLNEIINKIVQFDSKLQNLETFIPFKMNLSFGMEV
jgi:hypothetical protein